MNQLAGLILLIFLCGDAHGADSHVAEEASVQGEASDATRNQSEPTSLEPFQSAQDFKLETVAANLRLAREALQDEVRKGNIAQSAVEPLLAKITPVIERVAGELEEAGDNQELIQQILSEPQQIDVGLSSSEKGNVTQVISQVFNAGVESAKTLRPVSLAGAAAQPAAAVSSPAIVVQREISGYVAPILNGMLNPTALDSLAYQGAPQKQIAKPGRAVASIPVGGLTKYQAIGTAPIASPATVVSSSSANGVLPAPVKAAKGIRGMVASLVAKVNGGFFAKPTVESISAKTNSAGFSLLRPEGLSRSSALFRVPQSIWGATRSSTLEVTLGRPLAIWFRLIALMSAVAFSVATLWLVWRRRYFPRRSRKPLFSSGPNDVKRAA